MGPDTGHVQIDFILNLNKICSLNLNEETINELINKIGSDIIEVIKQEDKLCLRRKNFEEIKNKLKSIEGMEKESQLNINRQEQSQHNIQMNPPCCFLSNSTYYVFLSNDGSCSTRKYKNSTRNCFSNYK